MIEQLAKEHEEEEEPASEKEGQAGSKSQSEILYPPAHNAAEHAAAGEQATQVCDSQSQHSCQDRSDARRAFLSQQQPSSHDDEDNSAGGILVEPSAGGGQQGDLPAGSDRTSTSCMSQQSQAQIIGGSCQGSAVEDTECSGAGAFSHSGGAHAPHSSSADHRRQQQSESGGGSSKKVKGVKRMGNKGLGKPPNRNKPCPW